LKNAERSLTSEQDDFIRKAFIGGCTEVFETFGEFIFVYDLNSAYCAAMANCLMPAGKPSGIFSVEKPEAFFLFELDYFF